jgi:hypothetical protein
MRRPRAMYLLGRQAYEEAYDPREPVVPIRTGLPGVFGGAVGPISLGEVGRLAVERLRPHDLRLPAHARPGHRRPRGRDEAWRHLRQHRSGRCGTGAGAAGRAAAAAGPAGGPRRHGPGTATPRLAPVRAANVVLSQHIAGSLRPERRRLGRARPAARIAAAAGLGGTQRHGGARSATTTSTGLVTLKISLSGAVKE